MRKQQFSICVLGLFHSAAKQSESCDHVEKHDLGGLRRLEVQTGEESPDKKIPNTVYGIEILGVFRNQ